MYSTFERRGQATEFVLGGFLWLRCVCEERVLSGIAYHLRSRGAFSPSVSLFTHGKVEPATTVAFNFGPDFLAQVQFGDSGLANPMPMSSGHKARFGFSDVATIRARSY